jgi:DNA-directed RNA polymerase specialized sigma24 family protein
MGRSQVVTGGLDGEVATQLERIIRRVKRSMNYRGSFSTRDILGALVARWVHSGEWERLKQLPAAERHLGASVRRFILDRFDQLHRRGRVESLEGLEVTLPDEPALAELVELAELRLWISDRVDDLAAGTLDDRVRVPLSRATEVGRVLQLHLQGKTQREIAAALELSLGLINKRISEGTSYLILLQSIECGVT